MSQAITVKIKRLPHAHDLPLPVRMSAEAAGMDLAAAVDQTTVIDAGKIVMIACGFCMAIPPGYEAQVRPRSGLASRHGITLINTPGTIDSDYRGEGFVPLINLGGEACAIERGMRIAQMLICPVPPVQWVEVDELDDTDRGADGFGSSGT